MQVDPMLMAIALTLILLVVIYVLREMLENKNNWPDGL